MQDADLARDVQQLFASPYMRVNTTTDVTGVEICGALKNVLAIAAGIVEGLDLGHNAMAALVAQVRQHWKHSVNQRKSLRTGGLKDSATTCLHMDIVAIEGWWGE